MRCKNCGSKATPGRYCSWCGMLQPPRVAKGLRVAVTLLSVLAVLLLSAVGYVLVEKPLEKKAAEENRTMLSAQWDKEEDHDTGSSVSVWESFGNAAKSDASTEAAAPAETTQRAAEAEGSGETEAVPETQSEPAQDTSAPAEETEQPLLNAAVQMLEPEELEQEIRAIRAEYNAIEEGKSAGALVKQMLYDGGYVWFHGSEPVRIVVSRGCAGMDFSRSYYFTDGRLRFAYYEAADAYRLYFKDDTLLRLRYCVDARKASEAVDYDQTGGEEYDAWAQFALDEAYGALNQAYAAAEMQSAYILPDSDSRFLTVEDLDGFSAQQCRLARNEIFARHGRRFDDAGLQAYFDTCAWYSGTVAPADFSESVFNAYEAANVALIREYEQAMGYR